MPKRPVTDMAQMLSVLNGGEVARRLGVTRTTVSDWAHSPDPPPARVDQVRQLLLESLGHAKEAPPPQWATGLVNDVPLIRSGVEQVLNDLAILRALLEAMQSGLLPPDDDPVDDPPLQPTASRRDQ